MFRQIENIGPGTALEVLNQVHSKLGSIQDERSVSDMFFSFAPTMVSSVDASKIIDLARKGYDLYKWLLNRKQMSYFKTGMDEAKKTVKQRDLLRNAFDYYLTDTQTERFLYLSNYLEKLTEPLTNR